MGLERIYHFTLELDQHSRLFFPQAVGKKGRAFEDAVGARIRSAFQPLGGSLPALSVSRHVIQLTWQAGDDPAQALRKITALLNGGQAADGLLLLELFLSADPENPDLLYTLGTAYGDQNNLERSIDLLSRLVAIAPEHVNGRAHLGAQLLRAGKIAEGVHELEAAVRLDPENLWAHRNLGAGLMLLNRYSEAAANLRLARDIDADDQQAWFDYAMALDASDAGEQAESAYLKTIEIDEFSEIAEQARQRLAKLGEGKINH